MSDTEIRWLQSLNNFEKAFTTLYDAVNEAKKRDFSDIEKEGLIQRFEYNFELAWKTLKLFYKYLGDDSIQGPRDAFQTAFNNELLQSKKIADSLMKSIESRNNTVYSYNKETANEIYLKICDKYQPAFSELIKALQEEKIKRDI